VRWLCSLERTRAGLGFAYGPYAAAAGNLTDVLGSADAVAHGSPEPEHAARDKLAVSVAGGRPETTTPVALGTLAAGIGATTEAPEVAVRGVTLDSRDVRPGDLYAAVPGANVHRARFAQEAAAAGAVAILTDAAGAGMAAAAGLPVLLVDDPRARLGGIAATVYGRPAERLLTIGVTGTNGKTTTAYLLEAGLRAGGHETGLIGTIETRIGDAAVPSERTTPEATDLQALLAVMVEHGVGAVAMEVSSHALSLGRADGLVLDVALFTNLGSDHLDFHGDLEAYFQAKSALFTPGHARVGVVNLDDPYGRRLASSATVPVITYSCSGDSAADWRAEDLRVTAGGSTFVAVGPDATRVGASVQLPGRFNAENALGALVTIATAGLPADAAATGIASCAGVPGRMERVDAGQNFLALVDYAHTPEALATLLAALRPLTTGRLIVVVGCGGDRDQGKRAAMGSIAARDADVVVVTDDNPRSEDPAAIRRAVLAGVGLVRPNVRATVVEQGDRAAAIAAAVGLTQPGDVLVVAGKGHETTQHVGSKILPFDDREVLRTALGSLR